VTSALFFCLLPSIAVMIISGDANGHAQVGILCADEIAVLFPRLRPVYRAGMQAFRTNPDKKIPAPTTPAELRDQKLARLGPR